MASVIQPPPPPPATSTGPRPEERLVDEQIRRTRSALKRVDFMSGVLTLVIGVLVFLLFASAMEHWVVPGGWNRFGRAALFVVMLVGMVWYSWRTFWPLLSRPINPAYAAQLIERSSPSLKNSLLNFLLLRNRRQQLSQKVYQAIEQQAAQGLSRVSVDSVVDRSVVLRLGYVLAAVVAICALYRVLSPKNLTASMQRVVMPWSSTAAPSRVEILSVTPGDTEIARGESLEVAAEVMGLREGEAVRIRYSTLDKQAVDREVVLNGMEGSARFQGRLPDRFLAGENGGVQQDLEYWVEAGDARSQKYRVTVFARPTLVVEKIRYQFPHYTGLPPREVEGTGDVSALEGTQVSVYALANHDIASASVDFNADGRHDVPMTTDKMNATAQFTLALEDDRRTPEFESYVLQYKTTSGRTSSLPPKYSVDVTPDYAPEVKVIAPVDDEGKLVEQLDVPIDAPFLVEVEARDPDFALKNVVILGEVAGAEALKHDLLTKEHSGKFLGRMTATPKELNLKVGDVMDYSVAAIDNRAPEPNITRTDKLRIRVVGPPQFGQRPQGQQPQQGDGQQGGESGEGGQGQDGMQGPGEAGGAGEDGQQQGEASSSAGGEQGNQGESAGEQQAQGGQSGSEGNQQGESSSADGQQQDGQQQDGQQQNGQQGDGDQQQGGDSPSGDQQTNSDGQGAQQQQPQQGAGEQGKVSAEGDNDAEAFERMSDHFAEQDAESQGEGQSSKAGDETDQTESQKKNETSQGDGQGSPEDQEPTAEGGRNQDQGIDGAQEGEESHGSGAEGQPSEQREQPQSDAEHGDKGEQQEAPGGKMSTEQGEPGAGNNPGENEGSMDTDNGRKSREKTDEGPESELNDEEAPGQSNGQQESDSKGGQGGDRSGGGQEGAGQQADAEGTGTAGENTAADDGGGQAAEPGAGENSSQGGKQGESDEPTGESSETKPGEGSKQSDQPGGSKPGGEETGQSADGEQGGEPAPAGGEQSQSNPPEQPPANGPPGNQQGQGQQGQGQQDQQGQGQQSPTGGTGGNPTSPPPAGELEPGDTANLDYAKKQTDLVLDRLDEQLEKQSVDKQLLEKLGWTEDELRRFVDRWKALKAEAQAAPSEETRQELDNALRSLGLNPNRQTGYQSNATKEKLRQLQQSYRGQIPLEYADQVRAYIKGTATAADENE
jgi:collagen type III alpha